MNILNEVRGFVGVVFIGLAMLIALVFMVPVLAVAFIGSLILEESDRKALSNAIRKLCEDLDKITSK